MSDPLGRPRRIRGETLEQVQARLAATGRFSICSLPHVNLHWLQPGERPHHFESRTSGLTYCSDVCSHGERPHLHRRRA